MEEQAELRARIVAAATRLITKGGRDAATTRAVADAADVQAPTIYRLFGDKHGLLAAVAEQGLAAYIAKKAVHTPHADALQDIRDGWDTHVDFGLSHPGLFAILSGDPEVSAQAPSLAAGHDLLRGKIRRLAKVGRLRVSEERAVALMQSACVGVVLTLLGQPHDARDEGLSVASREAVIAAITVVPRANSKAHTAESTPRRAATALRASLDQTTVLSKGERQLLEELLDRIADG